MRGDDDRPKIIIRKVKKGGHEGHHGGAWKVAYADFVTAMMAFFLLLWLVSSPDDARLKGLAEYFSPEPPSVTSGSNGAKIPMPSPASRASGNTNASLEAAPPRTVGASRGGSANVPEAALRVMAQEMKIAIDALPEVKESPDSVHVEAAQEGIRITLMDTDKRAMFRGTTAQLNDYARRMLASVARKLRDSRAQIAIEGHTDSVGGQSEFNWRLSAERALSARAAMAEAGLLPDRFAEIVAMAGSRPVYPDQPERPENRRITIVVLAEAASLPSDVSFQF
ncbi:flagellar motor protein MotB [Iodidimonas sp. SYSU 1G8]|uniref:flagellar motor protein MotB n=1 Tax=Iodidimonas sp. SYSU 1G8 TaxID=3133967 RepID=UPI0031FEAD9D